MDLSNKTIDFLNDKNIKFERIVLEREPKWADDIVKLYWLNLNQILKTLLFIWKEPVLLVLPWNKKVDLKKLKKILNIKNIRIASFDEVEDITWYKVNGIWPFGFDKKIRKIIDKKSFEVENVSIWSGEAKIWLLLKSSDLKKIWDGEIGDFSK